MILAWDFKYTNERQETRETRTSQSLLNEVTYPVMMHTVIDDRSRKSDPLGNGLFMPRRQSDHDMEHPGSRPVPETSSTQNGTVYSVLQGFGFIRPDGGGENLFFHASNLSGIEFDTLVKGDAVVFEAGRNEKGPCALKVRKG